jgi:Reverse transcriptase (RNA-dependent DNA polymerase)
MAHVQNVVCVDLKDGYYQIGLAKESRHWKAVRTSLGLFQYTRMAQGLVKIGATFQRMVNGVLGNMRGESAEAYMDDVSVGTDDERSHISTVGKLFGRLLDLGMRVKFSKCAFGKREVESLGHKISHNAILPSDGHVDAMKEFQEPKDGDSLCRFIGVANYFSRHIPNLTQHLLSLYEVLVGSSRKKRKFKRYPVVIEDWDRKWGDAQREAFFALRALLSDPVVLAAPRHGAKKRVRWMPQTQLSVVCYCS